MKALRLFASSALSLILAFACGGATTGTAPPVWASCTVNSECTLTANSCCGVCGAPALDDVDAVNGEQLDAHFKAVCPEPVPCPKCGTANNPNLLSTCSENACKAVDVRQDSVSECASDGDCRLRVTGCCECGGSSASNDLIAINASREEKYLALVCDEKTSCPTCAPIYPTDVEAYCKSGHCSIRSATPAACSLQFDPGPCEALFRAFAFVDGACVEETYGGCQGNANRFSTIEECMAACQGQPNPNGCPPGRLARTVCLACGMAGGCGNSVEVCAKTCEAESDCDEPSLSCVAGLCQVSGCD